MIQRCERLGFAFETREPFRVGCKPRRQNLDGDVPIEFRITGAIHFAHTALSNEGLDLVWAEACSRNGHVMRVRNRRDRWIIPTGTREVVI